MNLVFFGISDIVIVVLFLLFILIGAKYGFLKKFISMIASLAAVILAFLFTSTLSNVFIKTGIFYNKINETIYTKLSQTAAFYNPDATVSDYFVSLGMPRFISNMIASNIPNVKTSKDIATNISTSIAKGAMYLISFIIILLGVFLISILLKRIVSGVRETKGGRFIDGVFGVIAYTVICFILIYVVMFGIALFMKISPDSSFTTFMKTDLQLDTDKFRLSKYFYTNNILINFFGLNVI